MKRSKRISILIFSAYIPPHVGGVERYTSNLVKKFVEFGYQPIIVTSNYNNDKEIEEIDGVVIIRLSIYDIFKNRYPIIRLNKQDRVNLSILNKYDIKACIVNTRFYLTSILGVKYCKKNNIPVYLIEHGSNYVTLDNKLIDFFANRYEDILTYWLRNKVDGFYGVSDACGKWLSHFGIKASGTWYNSIEIEQNLPKKSKSKEINFLYTGRIIKQKGVYNILKCFSNLCLKYDNIHLYIAGDGADLDSYKEKFSHDRIIFLGRVNYDKLLVYYSMCDIFLYPPLWPEGLPTSILEAGMMGCAVIATDRGGIKEIITNNENGIIVSDKMEDLERAMERLILDDKLRKNFSNKLYDTVKNKFTWDVTAMKILNDINLE